MYIQMKQAQDRGIALLVEYKISNNMFINSDEARIKQVLMGLQSNALKFTEKGFVKIIVDIERVRD